MFGATDWLHVALMILVVAAFCLVAYYRYLWKALVNENDRWLDIAEKLASHQHQPAMEGLREYRAKAWWSRSHWKKSRCNRADEAQAGDQGAGYGRYGEQSRQLEVNSDGDSEDQLDADRRERYKHCSTEEASEVNHHDLGEEDQFIHYDDLGAISEACDKFGVEPQLFCELLEAYGGDHLKRQILTALATVIHYLRYGRDEEAGRLMADVQYKVGGSTFVNLGLRLLGKKIFGFAMRS